MKILLIDGPQGLVQGWGGKDTTKCISSALEKGGHDVYVADVRSPDDMRKFVDVASPDLVWSSFYFLSDDLTHIGQGDGNYWIADMLDKMNVNYVGSPIDVLRTLISKDSTNKILSENEIPVPNYVVVGENDTIPYVEFPVFVKPSNEGDSVGISEESVVTSKNDLKERIENILEKYEQPVLIEEYLPGMEVTVPVLGNQQKEAYPIQLSINPMYISEHAILTPEIKYNDLLEGKVICSILNGKKQTASDIAKKAMEVLGAKDNIRIDMREDKYGNLKIIDVNGLPSLKPIMSYVGKAFELYNPQKGTEDNYTALINTIVKSAYEKNLRVVDNIANL